MQFGGERELGIHRFGGANPQLGQVRLDVSVERSVDLDHVEAARQNLQRVLFAVLHARRIEDAVPVLVRPAGSADADLRGWIQEDLQVRCQQTSICGGTIRDGPEEQNANETFCYS